MTSALPNVAGNGLPNCIVKKPNESRNSMGFDVRVVIYSTAGALVVLGFVLVIYSPTTMLFGELMVVLGFVLGIVEAIASRGSRTDRLRRRP
jgi:hypothetical protein